MTIGSRIAKCRKKKNLSQAYVAEILEVTRQAVSKWETDVNVPDTENLIKLAKLFGVSVEYLACGDDDAHLKITENISVLCDDESIFDNTKADTPAPVEETMEKQPSLLSRLIGLVITFVGFVISFFSWAGGVVFIIPFLFGIVIMLYGLWLTMRTKCFWD